MLSRCALHSSRCPYMHVRAVWAYLQTMAALGYNPLVATTIALHGNAVDCLNQDNE